ncbi:MAG: TadE/TadG family type IV pilus assembly protein [Pannonibacter sp.]
MVNWSFWASSDRMNRRVDYSTSRQTAGQASFAQDRRGVAAVEFALALPIMLILMIGSAETTEALNYKRKVNQVAISVADLVAQAETVSKADMTDIMYASSLIMEPYSASKLKVIVASIEFDAKGAAKVAWSINETGGTPWTKGSNPPITIPSGLNTPNTTMIVGQTNGQYIPTFAELAQNIMPRATSIDMEGIYFLRPRFTESVTMK